MAVTISFNQLIEVIKDIAVRHQNINSFYLGKNWELENQSIDVLYPVLQVYTESARMPENDNNEYKIIELDLRFRLIDRVFQGEGNEKDTLSDMLSVAKDIVNEINRHPYYKNSYIKLINNINFTPLEEQGTDFTAGHEFLLTLKILNYNTFCGLPFEGIEGFSVSGPEFSGGTYNTQYLTCSTLTGCSSFQNYLHNNYLNLTGGTLSGALTGTSAYFNIIYLSGVSLTDTFLSINSAISSATTAVQSGLNTYTGGTILFPTVNISGGTFDNLTVTGTTSFCGGQVYLDTINSCGDFPLITINGNIQVNGDMSASTYYSGSTPLQSIITNIITASTLSGAYLNLSGGTVTGATTFQSGLTSNIFYVSGYDSINPQVTNAIDTNTGIMFDGPDILSLHTGGIQRLLINAAGAISNGNLNVPSGFNTYYTGATKLDTLTANTVSTSAITHSTNILNQIGTTSTNYGTRTDAVGFKIAKTSNLTTANSFPFYLEGSASGRYMRYNANTFDVITGAETALNVLVQGSSINPCIYMHKADNADAGPVIRVSKGYGGSSNANRHSTISFGLPSTSSVFSSIEDSASINASWCVDATTTTSTQYSKIDFRVKNAGKLVTPFMVSANTAHLTGVLYNPVSSQSNTTSAYTINCGASNIIEFTATTACTLSYSGASEGQYKFIINNSGAYTVTFATGSTWYSNLGVQPNITGLVYIDAVYSKGRMFINELENMQQI